MIALVELLRPLEVGATDVDRLSARAPVIGGPATSSPLIPPVHSAIAQAVGALASRYKRAPAIIFLDV